MLETGTGSPGWHGALSQPSQGSGLRAVLHKSGSQSVQSSKSVLFPLVVWASLCWPLVIHCTISMGLSSIFRPPSGQGIQKFGPIVQLKSQLWGGGMTIYVILYRFNTPKTPQSLKEKAMTNPDSIWGQRSAWHFSSLSFNVIVLQTGMRNQSKLRLQMPSKVGRKRL